MSYVNAFQSLNEFGEAAFEEPGLDDDTGGEVFLIIRPKEFHQLQPRGARHSMMTSSCTAT